MRLLGDYGEKSAQKYLLRRRYKILECNFTVRGGEIDIIAKDGETLVFVEVKTRKTEAFGKPAEYVGTTKQQRLIFAAKNYIHQNGLYDIQCRFDVVEVIGHLNAFGKWKTENISHIKDAFCG